MRTRAPRRTLLRKCINPLWYFHPEAAKYRGLSEGDAVSAETYAGDMMLFRITSPARAAWICGCPVQENHTVVFLQPPSEAQLPSSGRGDLREICDWTAAPIFHFFKIGACNSLRFRLYCVQRSLKSDCFPPVAAGDSETVVFYCTPYSPLVWSSIHVLRFAFVTRRRALTCSVGKSARCIRS